MKIAIINNLYPPFSRGGAEKVCQNLASELKRAGHQIFIITTKKFFDKTPAGQDKIYYINSLYPSLSKLPKIIRFFWHGYQLIKPIKGTRIKKILKKEKPDLVITNNLLGLGWRLPLILKRLKIKQRHILHDIQLLHPSGLMFYGQEKIINTLPAKIYQFFLRSNFKFTSELSSPSAWLWKLHQQKNFFPKSKIEIGHSLSCPKEKIAWPKKINKLLFVGQLEKHKGLLWLLDCADKWRLQGIRFSLSIVGDGSLKKKIIVRKKNNPQLKILGQLNSQSVRQEIQKSDCLIVPSLCYENFPTVILEANQEKKPVAATALGGLSEIADNFNCRLFPPGNETALRKILFPDS